MIINFVRVLASARRNSLQVAAQQMIFGALRKSECRLSEKIMLHQ